MALEKFNDLESLSSVRTKINATIDKVNALGLAAETHTPVLTFDKNKYTETAISQSAAIAYTLAGTGNVDGVVIRHKILSDGVNPITFSADFNVFNISTDNIYPSGIHILYFNYVGGEVDVVIPTYSAETAPVDTTAPTIISATVENANPSTLVVVFSEVVTITDVTGLTIAGDATPTLSAPTGSGTSTLSFTLSAPLVGGQTVTLEVAGTNNIIDTASNALVAVSKAITNNVAVLAFAPSSISPEALWYKGDIATTDANATGDAITLSTDSLTTTPYDSVGTGFATLQTKNNKECLYFGNTRFLKAAIPDSLYQNTFSIFLQMKPQDGISASIGVLLHDQLGSGATNRLYVWKTTDGNLYVEYKLGGTTVSATTTTNIFADGEATDFSNVAITINSGGLIDIYVDNVLQAITGGDMTAVNMASFTTDYNLTIGARDTANNGSVSLEYSGWLRNIIIQPVAYTSQNRVDLATL